MPQTRLNISSDTRAVGAPAARTVHSSPLHASFPAHEPRSPTLTSGLNLVGRKHGPTENRYEGTLYFPDGHHSIVVNRPFTEVNTQLRFIPERMIEALQRIHPHQKIEIVDFGGGPAASALTDIVARWGDTIAATNVDLIAGYGGSGRSKIRHLVADATATPLPDASAHLVISYMLCTNLPSEAARAKFISEVVRVLKLGGAALIDDDSFLANKDFSKLCPQKEGAPEVRVVSVGKYLRPWSRFQNIIGSSYVLNQRHSFFIITKGEPHPDLQAVISPSFWNWSLWKERHFGS